MKKDETKNVLLIGDENSFRIEPLNAYLQERCGSRIRVDVALDAGPGGTANGYDLVLFDDAQKEYHLSEWIASKPKPLCPVIVFTNDADWKKVRACFRAGAADCLPRSQSIEKHFEAIAPYLACTESDSSSLNG